MALTVGVIGSGEGVTGRGKGVLLGGRVEVMNRDEGVAAPFDEIETLQAVKASAIESIKMKVRMTQFQRKTYGVTKSTA